MEPIIPLAPAQNTLLCSVCPSSFNSVSLSLPPSRIPNSANPKPLFPSPSLTEEEEGEHTKQPILPSLPFHASETRGVLKPSHQTWIRYLPGRFRESVRLLLRIALMSAIESSTIWKKTQNMAVAAAAVARRTHRFPPKMNEGKRSDATQVTPQFPLTR